MLTLCASVFQGELGDGEAQKDPAAVWSHEGRKQVQTEDRNHRGGSGSSSVAPVLLFTSLPLLFILPLLLVGRNCLLRGPAYLRSSWT